jgi:hypothetical protein
MKNTLPKFQYPERLKVQVHDKILNVSKMWQNERFQQKKLLHVL